ncbi:MAG: uracil-DNA glycosylase [Erysipelotrichaceae bacterium]|nr:uracil-DNA glycosylase [Erysipelotrichaceae bacterium]
MFQNEWTPFLKAEFEQPYFKQLSAFLREQYATKTIYPPRLEVFSSFEHADMKDIKVVILGQDPYHQPHQAHGMCFSVRKGVKIPPSLMNIYKEIHDDLGYEIPSHGYLMDWANQGVLLLNTVLTVEYNQAFSHRNQGWEIFTDHVLQKLNTLDQPMVFLLWGRPAQNKAAFLNNPNHLVLKAAHPSPLSAYQGFFGCRHFSKSNRFLIEHGCSPIDWRIR